MALPGTPWPVAPKGLHVRAVIPIAGVAPKEEQLQCDAMSEFGLEGPCGSEGWKVYPTTEVIEKGGT